MPAVLAEPQIHERYALSAGQIEHFRARGYVKLKEVFCAETLAHYGAEITRMVQMLNTEDKPLEARDTYGKAFLQVMNLWTKSRLVREFVFGRRLARIAAELLGARGVRLYHDQALYKESGGGITPWHADQHYWPLATEKCVTAWVPLQATPREMGPLAFAAGSQGFCKDRSLKIGDESETELERLVREAGYAFVEEPFDLGEVSFHYGWTLHRAGANRTQDPRAVMTVIYMDAEMRLKAPENPNQVNDWKAWCAGARVGEVIETPLNPVVY